MTLSAKFFGTGLCHASLSGFLFKPSQHHRTISLRLLLLLPAADGQVAFLKRFR